MTTCLAHPDRAATATCGACGADLCGECEVRAQGASWCEACFAARVHGAAPPPPRAAPPTVGGAPLKSPAAAAFFSLLVPGLGTIYAFNGPAKRGLVQFATWALLLWTLNHADGLFAGVVFFAWLGFYFWQAIDAHASARLINSLGRIPSEDEAADLGKGPYLLRNADARSLGTALLVVGCLLLAVELGGMLLSGLRWLAPLALIAGGAWIVVRARRRVPGSSSAAGEGGLA